MRVVRFILDVLLELIKTAAYGWLVALIDFIRRLIERIKERCVKEKIPHPFKDAAGSCFTVAHPAFRRPDPCIYSQSYLMKLGLPVTWDNPDIILRRNGVIVPEHDLQPGTLYEIEADLEQLLRRACAWNDGRILLPHIRHRRDDDPDRQHRR